MKDASWIRGYEAARNRSAYWLERDRVLTEVRGEESAKFLHGMLTADVKNLPLRHCCPASLLAPKGKVTADLVLYRPGDFFWIETERSRRGTLEAEFRKYRLGTRVEFRDLSSERLLVEALGPDARRIAPDAPGESEVHPTEIAGRPAYVARFPHPIDPTYRIWLPPESGAAAGNHLAALGAVELGREAREALRIEAGIPRFGADMTEEQLVSEIPYLAAGISHTKGCYLGQETVARLHARGEHVARRLMGVSVREGKIDSGAAVRKGERVVGRVTSVTFSPRLNGWLALSLIHREAFEPETEVSVEAEGRFRPGRVISLPIA